MPALPNDNCSFPPSLPELFEDIYARLKELSLMFMRHQPAGHTLQPTAIVHEAFVRLAECDIDKFKGEEHFFATAAAVLRSVLVDHARRRGCKKRGGGRRKADVAAFEPADASADVAGVLEFEDALATLAKIDPRSAKVAELRIFGGLSMEHVARLNGTSIPTAERDWRFARAFLEKQYGRASSAAALAGGATEAA